MSRRLGEKSGMRESHIRVRVVYMQRVVSMLEPLACRQSSVGGLICMQGAICLWAVTMFWVDELSLGRRQSVRRPSLSRGNACKVGRSEDREGWLGSQKEKRKGSLQMLGSPVECYLLEASKTVDGHLCPSWLPCGL